MTQGGVFGKQGYSHKHMVLEYETILLQTVISIKI